MIEALGFPGGILVENAGKDFPVSKIYVLGEEIDISRYNIRARVRTEAADILCQLFKIVISLEKRIEQLENNNQC